MIKVYASEDLEKAIQEYCEDMDVPVSAWMRRLAMAELSRRRRLIVRHRKKFVEIRDR